jgi:two-component sensor histidine kinase
LPTTTTGAVPAHGLRAHLVALVLAILLPSMALGAATAWQMAGNYRTAFEERLSGTAQGLALALDREVQSHIAALTALAASPRFNDDDLAGFYAHARGAAEALGTSVVVIGADLRQRLHTDRAFGVTLPMTAATEEVRRAYETGLPVVSGYLVGAVLHRPVVVVLVPVTRQGQVVAVLAAPLPPERLSALLAMQRLSEGAFATLFDGRNIVMARSSEAVGFQGRKALDWFVETSTGSDAGIAQGRSLTGEDVILAYRRLTRAPAWVITVAEPLATYDASWQRPLVMLGLGGAATFVVALIAAAWLGRRILHPVQALTRQAEAVAASGGEVALAESAPARVAEFEVLRLAMLRADATIRARAADAAAGEARKTLLMREVDHRAKNVLAVVQSVIRLTPRDKPEVFATAVEARVAALARTHSLLAEGGWYGADLRAVAERALAPYMSTPNSGTVRLDGPPVPLVPAAVQPIAMVLHELATNAARYGALSVPGGAVTLAWWVSKGGGDDRLHMRWAEMDGAPVPGTPTRQGFGTRLIDTSVRGQLGGSVTRRWESTGLICEISIPLIRAVATGNDEAATGPGADIPSGAL